MITPRRRGVNYAIDSTSLLNKDVHDSETMLYLDKSVITNTVASLSSGQGEWVYLFIIVVPWLNLYGQLRGNSKYEGNTYAQLV